MKVSAPYNFNGIELSLEGEYYPYVPAYTPRGEYAPIDPPEPEHVEDIIAYGPDGKEFEWDNVYLRRTHVKDGKMTHHFDSIEEAFAEALLNNS